MKPTLDPPPKRMDENKNSLLLLPGWLDLLAPPGAIRSEAPQKHLSEAPKKHVAAAVDNRVVAQTYGGRRVCA
jgi:hypothetical protein